jgi:tRNA isopentenyl-2-thiomethyl-A-37 hydroxylase MiaE
MENKEKQLANDLVEIFDKEYQKRGLLTPTFTAKQLCGLGYQKVNEDSVVISREEYEELKQAKSLLEFREETIKYLEDANIRYAEALELKVNKKERKETAEKILNEVNEFFRPFDKKSPIFLDLLLTKLETVVKKIGVEIKE